MSTAAGVLNTPTLSTHTHTHPHTHTHTPTRVDVRSPTGDWPPGGFSGQLAGDSRRAPDLRPLQPAELASRAPSCPSSPPLPGAAFNDVQSAPAGLGRWGLLPPPLGAVGPGDQAAQAQLTVGHRSRVLTGAPHTALCLLALLPVLLSGCWSIHILSQETENPTRKPQTKAPIVSIPGSTNVQVENTSELGGLQGPVGP